MEPQPITNTTLPPRTCHVCRYALEGLLPQGVCPECATPIRTLTPPLPALREMGWARRWTFYCGPASMGACFVLPILFATTLGSLLVPSMLQQYGVVMFVLRIAAFCAYPVCVIWTMRAIRRFCKDAFASGQLVSPSHWRLLFRKLPAASPRDWGWLRVLHGINMLGLVLLVPLLPILLLIALFMILGIAPIPYI